MAKAKTKPKVKKTDAAEGIDTLIAASDNMDMYAGGIGETGVPFGANPPPASEEISAVRSVAVPSGRRPAQVSLDRTMLWLYGDTGTGKTTLAGKFPGVWFLSTEPGQQFISAQEPTLIESWEHFIEICAMIETDRPRKFGDGEAIRYLCIDTADLLWKMCNDDVCGGLGVEDPSELGHGKGWARLNSEFSRVITKMRRWPFGLICISHARTKAVKMRGREITRMEPDIGAGGYRVLSAAADFMFYAFIDDQPVLDDEGNVTGEILEQYTLQCHPTNTIAAKCRPGNFPAKIPTDYDHLAKILKVRP